MCVALHVCTNGDISVTLPVPFLAISRSNRWEESNRPVLKITQALIESTTDERINYIEDIYS